eukprot:CAMPEP_0206203322 /NCGR_PEP_ID=MMETSP0166-20121206/12772_1 /ASSEMBLY_ACC=CAM_ASM_000260 /TAXON_ID=95228 /ORGANISM="Vannella robusta, Strain DIVA3 518/3/11/1/6" /LENGTH=259 /DNA_ID=CAMNT_0053622561 /DNA_START=1 /DNA_END=777 /DNA_ORIENTATION=+
METAGGSDVDSDDYTTEESTKDKKCGVISMVIIFVVLFVFVSTLIGLGWGIQKNLRASNGIVVSPFEEIVQEYAPQSTLTCFYPTLSQNINGTYACNFENTNSEHFCPEGYACQEISSNGARPFGCVSEHIVCGSVNMCANSVASLDLLNNNETARVINNFVPSTTWTIQTLVSCTLAMTILFAIILYWHPTFDKYSMLFAALAALSLLTFCIANIVFSSLFLSQSPEPFEISGLDGGCYNDQLNAVGDKLGGCATGYF